MDTLALGLALGLGAGLSPGPLLAALIAATLDRGFAAGARVALAPLITDLPIVVLSVLVLQELPGAVLAALSLAGAAFLAYLAVEALRPPPPAAAVPAPAASDLRRGMLVNVLSPHPWVFWIAVGAPVLVDAADDSVAVAVGFVAAFYLVLVGSKLAMAGAVAAGRRGPWARRLRPVSAALFAVAAVALLADGLSRL